MLSPMKNGHFLVRYYPNPHILSRIEIEAAEKPMKN
jgi:hypothetical protein